MENNRPKRPKRHAGGQHRPATGVSTWDGETPAERRERLRREHRRLDAETGEHYRPRFDIDGATDSEPQSTPDEAALAEFWRELQRAIDRVDWSQPF
jgi:hypothetical protein